jgi:two-component system, cell cycle sensor histidine kinase and response regulator CckA
MHQGTPITHSNSKNLTLSKKKLKLRTVPILFTVISVLILTISVSFYQSQKRKLVEDIEHRLSYIAKSKISRVVEWRDRRISEATLLSESPFFIHGIDEWLMTRSDASKKQVYARLYSLKENLGYDDVILVDSKGAILVSVVGRTETLHEEALCVLQETYNTQQPMLTDLHEVLANGYDGYHIDTIAPLFSTDGHHKLVGAVVLQMNAMKFLRPIMSTWPTLSRSAEAILIRRDKDTALYLNELKFQDDAVHRFRIPLTQKEAPAVQAILGYEGIVKGRDYRNVKVISSVGAVPGSPWFVVVKIDQEEAFQDWHFRTTLILVLIVVLAMAVVAIGGAVWYRHASIQYRVALQAVSEKHAVKERYKTTLMSVGDGVIATDSSGRIELMNPVAEELTGWQYDEARHQEITRVFNIVNEESRASVKNPVFRALEEGCIIGLANHTVLISKDGLEFPIADSVAPVRDDSGTVIGTVLVFRDQSKERAVAQRLQAESAKRAALLAAIPDIVMEVDANKVYTWANQAGMNFFGPEVVGSTPYNYLVEEPAQLDEMVKPIFDGDEAVIYVESWQRRFDGVPRLLAWWCRVLKDVDGNVVGALSSARDITEAKDAETALLENEKEYRRLVQNIPGVVFKKYQDHGINFFDEKIEQLSGYPKSVFLDRVMRWDDLVHPDDIEEYKRVFSCNTPYKVFAYEYRIRVKGGNYCWVRESSQFISNGPGFVPYFNGILFDITEQVDLEEEKARIEERLYQAQKMEAIGALAGGIAHDFNNILAAVMGYTEMALGEIPSDASAVLDLEQVLHASKRAQELVKQILSFTRQGDLQEKKPVSLRSIIQEATKLLRPVIPATIELNVTINPESTMIVADAGQIHQVIVNLCTNAIHAMQGQRGALDIQLDEIELKEHSAQLQVGPGIYMKLVIKDTGHGMDRETIQRIFDPYYTTKEVGEGSGLGLTVVHGIVERHEGVISVDSKVRNGTVFTILLRKAEGLQEPQIEEVIDPIIGGTERILYVDDEPALAMLGKRMLKQFGYLVTATSSSEDALQIIRENPENFDLVVTDYTMPNLTGTELAKEILEIRPDIPIVLCTGHSENLNETRAKEIGIRAFSMKPLDRKRLSKLVRETLDQNDKSVS